MFTAGWCQRDGCPSSIGWEVGPVPGKLGPRVAELASSMDPRALAQSAVNLNLGLMRWRAAPALDLERLSSTRCLLLGAGMPSKQASVMLSAGHALLHMHVPEH